jgi:ribonuclease PH
MARGSGIGRMRPVNITPHYLKNLPRSVLVEFGNTAVLCSTSIEDRVPPFLKGAERGWVTAEYSMLPGSSRNRVSRDSYRGGRSLEISRLIGRSLRMSADLVGLGERTVTVDCDVLQADGGTRTAAITGGWVSLALAERELLASRSISHKFLTDQVAAVSVGMSASRLLLDLCYDQDSSADVDLNVVALRRGGLAEVQGTAERRPFSPEQLNRMVRLALNGIRQLYASQERAIKAGLVGTG